ncbi:MAG: TVP38/TMEM64 family protein [Clostridia bacterium]|nr:TVP38/TMEM64 family protein [Clostridia bacterium]
MSKNKEKKAKPVLTPEEKSARVKAILKIVMIVGIVGVLSLVGYLAIQYIFNDAGYDDFSRLIEENSLVGALVMILVNFIQVVVAFIPGEIVEQATGMFFGPVWGTLICLAGTVCGSCLALFLAKKFGRNLIYAICPKEKIDSISFLHDAKKRDFLTFTLFFMPGTPKDVLTYAVGLTDMGILRYVVLTTFARIPSILMSTLSGDWINDSLLGKGKIWPIIILNAASLLLCCVGYLIYMLINKKHTQRLEKKEQKAAESSEACPPKK